MELSSWVETIPPQGFVLAKVLSSLLDIYIFIRETEHHYREGTEYHQGQPQRRNRERFQKTEKEGVCFVCVPAIVRFISSIFTKEGVSFPPLKAMSALHPQDDLESEPLETRIRLLKIFNEVQIREHRLLLLLMIEVILCFMFSLVLAFSLFFYGIPCHLQYAGYSGSMSKSDSLHGSMYSLMHHDVHGDFHVTDLQTDRDGISKPHVEVVANQDPSVDLYRFKHQSAYLLHDGENTLDATNDQIFNTPNVVSDGYPRKNLNRLSTQVELEEMQLMPSVYEKIFQDLMDEGLLHVHDKALCLGTKTGEEFTALKKKELQDVVSIDDLNSRHHSVSKESTSIFTQMLVDERFDFVFTTLFDEVPYSDFFVAEIERVLKSGGIAVMHVSLDVWHNKFLSSKGGHGTKPVTLLFHHSNIVYVTKAEAFGLDTIIVFKKTTVGFHEDAKPKQLTSKVIWPGLSVENDKHDPYLEFGKFQGERKPQSEKEWIKVSGFDTMYGKLQQFKEILNDKAMIYVWSGGADNDHTEAHHDLKNDHHFGGDLFQATASSSSWIRTRINLMIGKALSGGQSDYYDRKHPMSSDFSVWLERSLVPDDVLVVFIDLQYALEFDLVSKMAESGSIHLIDKLFLVCDQSSHEQGQCMAYSKTFSSTEVFVCCGQ